MRTLCLDIDTLHAAQFVLAPDGNRRPLVHRRQSESSHEADSPGGPVRHREK